MDRPLRRTLQLKEVNGHKDMKSISKNTSNLHHGLNDLLSDWLNDLQMPKASAVQVCDATGAS